VDLAATPILDRQLALLVLAGPIRVLGI